ncbi:MAG: YggU family protein [Nitrospirae bacterium]|nr:YggU family protein [Nitrospirota bacterium]
MAKAQSGGKNKTGLTIKIKVEPRSSKSGIVGPYGDALKVKLTSPPVEGRANKELIEVLAKGFGIAKKDVEIISGQSSKNKTVKLIGVKSIDDTDGK